MQKDWPIRGEIDVGNKNITNVPLADKKKVVFLKFHIELGVIKQFGKALYKEGNCFQYKP